MTGQALPATQSVEMPSTASDDVVYPLFMLDDTKTLRGIVVTWTLHFNDVLDPAKLHNALTALLKIGDWRKIGGRLRMRTDSRLEICAPRNFTPERSAITYSQQRFDLNIEDHPLARTLPKATKTSSVQVGPDDFRSFAAGPSAPTTLADFLDKDKPLLSMHITSFSDATSVGLSWPHVLMDIMGQQALVRAWSLVLAEREAEVPQCIGAHADAIAEAASSPASTVEEYALGKLRMGAIGMIKFGARFAWDLLWNTAVETRTVCIPAQAMSRLYSEAQQSLATSAAGTGNSSTPFVSEGDVLTAFFAHQVVSSLKQPRPVTILHALNARFRLPALKASKGVYIQNMAVAACAYLSADLVQGPLGPAALQNRATLLEQATEHQVLAALRELHEQHQKKPGVDPNILSGDPNALLMPFTNWTRANLFEAVDFSPAIVRSSESGQTRSNPPGTMVYHHAASMQSNSAARNVIVVLGKDLAGNYWVTGVQLTTAAWARIENALQALETN
ncbi:hypothetical protein CB0940_06684 [Cercospora beticola]|uniref:Uncharacterized protein n=1 Tax=Cercospora beticola TaxID=122368 RepID=A0A2G5I0V5_CERBT|nr:hypothetical protein CB0940_06684 [Cercospora beticola]PIA98132.1 hypothetical protein CB0940_06684 [Cercospora beticola]WPA99357.1 hypothetical protein RHO25_003974 [Cercospora beticola]CAK1360684.1 unnamed protein product [Cercospora beticola]